MAGSLPCPCPALSDCSPGPPRTVAAMSTGPALLPSGPRGACPSVRSRDLQGVGPPKGGSWQGWGGPQAQLRAGPPSPLDPPSHGAGVSEPTAARLGGRRSTLLPGTRPSARGVGRRSALIHSPTGVCRCRPALLCAHSQRSAHACSPPGAQKWPQCRGCSWVAGDALGSKISSKEQEERKSCSRFASFTLSTLEQHWVLRERSLDSGVQTPAQPLASL